MPKFPVDAPKTKVVRALEILGFSLIREGNHIAMERRNPDGTRTPLTIPNHRTIKGSTGCSAISSPAGGSASGSASGGCAGAWGTSCGHDVHTTIGLGTAEVLAGMRDRLKCTVKFIFQPAEEDWPDGTPAAASRMIREGVLENPRPGFICGLHAFARPVGELSCEPNGRVEALAILVTDYLEREPASR